MSRPGIAFLALRLAGLYFCIEAILIGLTAATMLFQVRGGPQGLDLEDQKVFVASLVTAPILLFVCGCMLFLWAPVLANKMFPDATNETSGDVGGIGGLALRLMGLLLAMRLMQQLPAALELHQRGAAASGSTANSTQLAGLAVLALVSAWLIISGPTISRWLLRDRATGVVKPMTARFQTIAFSIIGLWMLVNSLPVVIAMLVALLSRKMESDNATVSSLGGVRWQWQQGMSVVQVVLGTALFLGSHGLASSWHRIQTAGNSGPRGESREEVS